MIVSVLYANVFKKCASKNSLNEEQTFYFNFIEDILFFLVPVGKQTSFSKSQSP